MNYFIDVFRRAFDFEGRSRRSEYWYFVLFYYIISIGLLFFETSFLGRNELYFSLGWLTTPFALLSLIPSVSVSIRRLHDTGRSGWWILINLIFFVGTLFFIFWTFQDSQKGSNRWGPNPKGVGNDSISDHLVEEDFV